MKYTILLLATIFLFAPPMEERVRPFLSSGPWYPTDPGELRLQMDRLLSREPQPPVSGKILGLIVPHAGLSYSGPVAANAYVYLKKQPGIHRILLLGPSHHSAIRGAILSRDTHFSTPLGKVAVDTAAIAALAKKPHFTLNDEIMRNEHSLENQIPFLQTALKGIDFRIVPVLFGNLEFEDFGLMAQSLAPLLDASTLVVVSTDFTHYGAGFNYVPFSREIAGNLTRLDMGLVDPILRIDFPACYEYKKKTGITVCGFAAVGVLLKLLEGTKPQALMAAYQKSGDATGDYAHCVSYVSLVFFTDGSDGRKPPAAAAAAPKETLSSGEQRFLLQLARDTLRHVFDKKDTPQDPTVGQNVPVGLNRTCGVFVTLRQGGELRGCIGHIVGDQPLFRGVMQNALNAAFRDPRFSPLRQEELKKTSIEISVLTPLAPLSSYKKIRLGTDGVVIRDGAYQAVFLPQVATETGWPLDQFLAQLCRKAGLAETAYRTSPTMEFFVFQAQAFAEEEIK